MLEVMRLTDQPGLDSRLGTLLDVSRRLGGTIELTPLLQRVTDAARDVLGCERATVFLYDETAHELFSRVATGSDEIRFSADLGIAGQAARTGAIINVPDAYADARFNRDIDRQTGYRTRNLLAFPLRDHEARLVGVLQVLNKVDGPFTDGDEQMASVLSSLAGVAIQRQRLIEADAEKKKLERDLSLARDIQQSLLPQTPPTLRGFDIAGFNRPADATGGDCFDFVQLDQTRAAILVADATGHGIGPALLVSQLRTMLRVLMRTTRDPSELLRLANEQLCEDLPSGMFVTTFLGIIDAGTGELDYYSAGQGPLLYVRRGDARPAQYGSHTMPLGIVQPLPDEPRTPVRLGAGDVFLVLTDGFFEAAGADGTQFGVDRISEIVRRADADGASALIRRMNTALDDFISGEPQSDDLTAVVIKRC